MDQMSSNQGFMIASISNPQLFIKIKSTILNIVPGFPNFILSTLQYKINPESVSTKEASTHLETISKNLSLTLSSKIVEQNTLLIR